MQRVVLSAELIFSSALRLADDEGLDALTMRRLAETIGVATMSLYSHVATKEDVIRGLLNLVTGEIILPTPDTPPWEALRSVTREFRRVALRHPNLVPLIMREPPTGAEGPGLSDRALAGADRRVRIVMAAAVDSLNVATAAAVALHHLGDLR